MERVETFPKLQVDEGEERKQVIFGGQRTMAFIKDVVSGRPIDGKRYSFNAELIDEIHDRVVMMPGVKGFMRQSDSPTIGGDPVLAHWEDLPRMMQLFGRWLEEEMSVLQRDPENLTFALRTAAGAHYGLTSPHFHPYDNGNGRTARTLMNGVLMSQSYELTTHGLAIPPIPIVRTDKDSGHYIRSLRAVEATATLNPFMTFIAQKWIESLDERLNRIHHEIKTPMTHADRLLIEKLEIRRELLRDFVKSGIHQELHDNGHGLHGHSKKHGHSHDYQTFPVPDYFEPKYVKVEHA